MWRADDLYDTNHPNWNEITKSELTPQHALEFKKYSDKLKITGGAPSCSKYSFK